MSNQPSGERGQEPPGIMVYAGLGMLNVVCVLGGMGIGWAVDNAAGTLPLFIMIGLVVGIATGVLCTRSEIRRRG